MRERIPTHRRTSLFALLALLLSPALSPVQAQSLPGLTSRPLAPESQFHSQTIKAGRVRSDAGGSAVSGATPTSGRRVSVIVKLEDDPVATYTGGLPGLDATSPRATGRARLDARSPASVGYRAHLKAKRDAFEAAARQAIPGVSVVHRFDLVLGGVSMLVPADQLATLSRLPGVKGVYPDVLLQLHTERSPAFIGAPTIWSQLGGQGSAGEGVIVGVLDTGVWPEHPSFADPDPLGKPYAAPPPPLAGARQCEFCRRRQPRPGVLVQQQADRRRPLHGHLRCRRRPAPDRVHHRPRRQRPRNAHREHGRRQRGRCRRIFGLPRGTVSGIAPSRPRHGLQGVRRRGLLRVGLGGGGPEGHPGRRRRHQLLDQRRRQPLRRRGGAGVPRCLRGRRLRRRLGRQQRPGARHRRSPRAVGDDGRRQLDRPALPQHAHPRRRQLGSLTLVGASISGGVATPVPVVLASTLGDPDCLNPFAAGSLTGKIVACQRPGIPHLEELQCRPGRGRRDAPLRSDDAGHTAGHLTDNHWVPTVHLAAPDGASLVSFVDTHTGVTASFTAGVASATQGDRMASFSSRGGPGTDARREQA